MDDTILETRALSFSYGARTVLTEVNLKILRGTYTSVIGPNGSGKTTLLRLLYGECQGGGDVLYEGKDVWRKPVLERARCFAVVRQDEENGFPFTCLEMVAMGLHPFRSRFGDPTPEQCEHVRRVMERTETWKLADKPVTELSGGEFQRVILARALVQGPKILFLDEAMSELDISARIAMIKLLRALTEEAGLTVVAVTHDLAMAYRYSDCVVALHHGSIAAAGKPETVMDDTFFASVFGVKAEILPGKGFLIHDHI